MTIKRAEPKTALTFEEEITAAFMHYVRGIAQQDIAIMMGGVNGGRVNEACLAIKGALAANRRKVRTEYRVERSHRPTAEHVAEMLALNGDAPNG
jgi:hypothetical protein